MSSTNMPTYLKVIAVLVVIAAIAGAYAYPKYQNTVGSSVGSTFSTQKMIAVDMSPLTGTATSTSILNTDASARWIADFALTGCTGAGTSYTYPNTNATGLANLLIQAATTSVASQGLQGNTNYALNMIVSTSSPIYTESASSTLAVQAGYWASGTYMTLTFNATNTAACIVEMDYIPS